MANPFRITRTAPVAAMLSDRRFHQRRGKSKKDREEVQERNFKSLLKVESRRGGWYA